MDASSDQCRADAEGLRLTFFIVNLWLVWSVAFFGLSLLLASRALRRNKSVVSAGGDSRWFDVTSPLGLGLAEAGGADGINAPLLLASEGPEKEDQSSSSTYVL